MTVVPNRGLRGEKGESVSGTEEVGLMHEGKIDTPIYYLAGERWRQ